jgi:hypothetical protein
VKELWPWSHIEVLPAFYLVLGFNQRSAPSLCGAPSIIFVQVVVVDDDVVMLAA